MRSGGSTTSCRTLPFPPLFPIEVRASAADDIPLSTANGRASGWIAIHQYVGAPYEAYFQGVEQIMNDYAGRPHWGKLHFQSSHTLAAPLSRVADVPRLARQARPVRHVPQPVPRPGARPAVAADLVAGARHRSTSWVRRGR